MMDELEKHIKKQRASFESYSADRSKIWAEIESKLDQPNPITVPFWKSNLFRIAASIILALGILALVAKSTYSGFNLSNENELVNQELEDIDMYYQSLVKHQVRLVQNHPGLSKEEKEEFLTFIDELDTEYGVLKREMQRNLDNERVLEAIVSNYKKRIELIENLLAQINESKKSDDKDVYIL